MEAANGLVPMDESELGRVMRALTGRTFLEYEHAHLIADRTGGYGRLALSSLGLLRSLALPFALIDREGTEDLHVELGLGVTGLGEPKGHQITEAVLAIAAQEVTHVVDLTR